MKEVTVYTLPACVQCESTKRYLNKNSVEYNEVNLADDPNSLEMVRALGHTSAPVVIAGDESWSGFRMDKLSELHAK